jgi:hypothetical protein
VVRIAASCSLYLDTKHATGLVSEPGADPEPGIAAGCGPDPGVPVIDQTRRGPPAPPHGRWMNVFEHDGGADYTAHAGVQ